MLPFSLHGTCVLHLMFPFRTPLAQEHPSVTETWQHGCWWFGNKNSLLITDSVWSPGECLSSLHYLFLYCTGCRLRTIDLIVKNLIVPNILVLFSNGCHYTMTNYGWHHMDSDFTCRFSICSWSEQRCVLDGTTFLWVSSRPSPSVPRPPGGKSLKWKLCSWFPFNYPVLDREHAGKCCLSYVYDCWATKTYQTENVLDTVFLFIMTKSETHYMQHWYHSLMSYVLWSQSWPVAPRVLSLYRHKQRLKNFHRNSLLHILSWVQSHTKTVLLVVTPLSV